MRSIISKNPFHNPLLLVIFPAMLFLIVTLVLPGNSAVYAASPATKSNPAKTKAAAHCKSDQVVKSEKITVKVKGKNKKVTRYYCAAKPSAGSHGSAHRGAAHHAGCSGDTVDTDCFNTGLPNADASNDNLQNIIQIALGVIGGLAVLFVIIGGLRYVLAGDDSQAAARARGTIIYALVGGIIVIAAEIIVSLVLDKL